VRSPETLNAVSQAEQAQRQRKRADRVTPLHLASSNGHARVIELLLAAGANVNAINVAGQTPLLLAVSFDRLEAVEVLLKAGADTTIADIRKQTASSYAKSEAMRALLENAKKQPKVGPLSE
jgi:ankyrin repeat protein